LPSVVRLLSYHFSTSFFLYCYGAHPDLHSFPTRRSSDLPGDEPSINATLQVSDFIIIPAAPRGADVAQMWKVIDVLEQTPYAALLTQVRAGTTAISEALDALKEADVSFFETVIP